MMSKPNYFNIRYIDILVYWKILYQTKRFDSKSPSEILKSVSLDYSLGGSLPVESGLKIAIDQNTVEVKSEKLKITEKGNRLVSENDKFEPEQSNLRQLIRGILVSYKFPWIFFFDTNNQNFRIAIPDNWIQILDNANLLDVESKAVKEWWKSLLLKYNVINEERLKEIGEIGEKLTLQYEFNRLKKDGIDPELHLKWVSDIDDSAGYDVLSIQGNSFDGDCYSKLLIEVKTSQRKNTNPFQFKLTRNEWEKALHHRENYYFYFWAGVKSIKNFGSGPYLLKASELKSFVPVDQTPGCKWEVCAIAIDLKDI